jgi:NAD(P)-dependent dehydrogenase (short-subunit alcohol dehydrogenase family)
MDLGLEGKVAVVTGAGKGIGMAVTRGLAEEGALVVAGSRSTATLESLERVTPSPSIWRRRAVRPSWWRPRSRPTAASTSSSTTSAR